MDYGILIIFGILTVYLYSALRIANENERFAVFTLGRFVGLKGPGLILKLPGGMTKFVRIALGAEGEVQSNELVSLVGCCMPYTANGSVRTGSKVRVTGFSPLAVQVEPLQLTFVVCEKCGHKNAI